MKIKDPVNGALYESELRNKLSNRYEGLPESNNSHYVLFSASSGVVNDNDHTSPNPTNVNKHNEVPSISVMPVHGYISFAQPAKFKTLSMQDAEDAIASKNVSRYMMHNTLKNNNNNSNFNTNNRNTSQLQNARDRLLNNIITKNVDEEDDVMMDVAFREQKAGVSLKTRQELLSDFADSDMKVDHDGIIGGANDSEFAAGRRFGQMKSNSSARKGRNERDEDMDSKSNKRTKFDDGEIDDDFYQKDVGAQFEQVDCDLDALFDNNDEDMGAGYQDDIDQGGFADVEDDDSDVEDDEDLDLGNLTAKSFATKSGMEAYVKASGDNTELQTNLPTIPVDSKMQRKSGNLSSGSDRSEDEKESVSTKRKSPEPSSPSSVSNSVSALPISQNVTSTSTAIINGLRIISKDSVRTEIWLHGGSIKAKELFNKFKVGGKKQKERRKALMDICLELCTMDGDTLTLKQHYAKM